MNIYIILYRYSSLNRNTFEDSLRGAASCLRSCHFIQWLQTSLQSLFLVGVRAWGSKLALAIYFGLLKPDAAPCGDSSCALCSLQKNVVSWKNSHNYPQTHPKCKSRGCFGKFRIFATRWALRFSKLNEKWLRKWSLKLATPPRKMGGIQCSQYNMHSFDHLCTPFVH